MVRVDAIYARQSVEKKDSISIESQIEFCIYETRGAPYREYKDKGYSGKNLDRPQFQEMMAAIRKGEIKRVICYKLDRCSRSILDFANLMDELQKYNVEFVSCTEKFDTASPMGRAMLNICIVFAQLERETIQQRVTDAYHARSQRGFYMGGRIPYGYNLEPYILQGKKTSRYAICPKEAEHLMLIYTQYAAPQTSVGDILKYLDENKIQNARIADGHWSKSYITSIIKNPIYVKADIEVYHFFRNQGANVLNDPEDFIGTNGCYLFTDKGTQRKVLSVEGHNLVLAPHQGIIPADVWLRCRRKCMNNKQVAKPVKAKNTWLAGKIKCKKCGYALIIRRSGEKRYFICSRHLMAASACEGVGGLIADDIEAILYEAICEKVTTLGKLSRRIMACGDPRIEDLKKKLAQYQKDIDTYMSKMAEASKKVMGYINDKISELDERKLVCVKELGQLEDQQMNKQLDAKEISDYMSSWKKLTISHKITIVDALIVSIHASKEEISVEWKL